MFVSTVQDEDVARSAFEKALKQITDDFDFKMTFTTVLRKLADLQGELASEIFPIIAVMLTESNLIELLAGTLASNLSDALTSMLKEQQTKITLLSPDGAGSSKSRMLAAKFQESYIKQRIEAHARRVASHQLAAASPVIQGIQNTMTEALLVTSTMPAVRHLPPP
ncbi:hypothetical protein FRC07_004594 [Ceratobasidium sp. 392]|nr:hypothetical protein FRC07_004594 [Ceratobasidium sp. 392]